ncbi:MAG: DUF1624 domain-containing protein, partial [Gemmatimonadaceae bacterium]
TLDPRPSRDPRGARGARVDSIDVVRGLVVALMVLDHVREYWSNTALVFQPTDLARTTPALFATRWVTHLCAPTFVFLAGASVYLQCVAARDRRAVARFQVTRGLWLVALELTVVGFAFDFAAPFFFFQVIWAIGAGLVLLAALLRLPPSTVFAVGATTLLAADSIAQLGAPLAPGLPPVAQLAWHLLFAPGPAAPLPGFVAYPLLPWFGVLCMGYGAGPAFARPAGERRRALLRIGAAALALFALARLANVGDVPWRAQSTAVFTALAFLNVSKYPPSPLFVLVTLGVTLSLAGLLDARRTAAPAPLRPVGAVLRAFGRTPMFTYLLHVFLVHGSALAAGVALGFPARAFTRFLEDPAPLRALGWGFGLPTVYAVWAATCLALYPASRWYAARRARAPRWWMRYL